LRLLLDTNVLLLWIVGEVKPAAIGGKRLTEFDIDDFTLVKSLAVQVPNHISTPHILSEVSNFLGAGHQQLVPGGNGFLAQYIGVLQEVYVPAREIVVTPEFYSLGLTDAAILHIIQSDTRVVSVDFHLCNRLTAKGVDVVNPRNLRSP
jgi:hypothetical protein